MDKTAQPQNFLASVSDLMSGLLFVFMIVLMGFVHQASQEKKNFEEQRKQLEEVIRERSQEKLKLEQQRQQLEEVATNSVQVRTDILQKVISNLEGSSDVSVDEEGGVLRLGQEFLRYPSGGTSTLDQESLKTVALSLARELSCYVANTEKSTNCKRDNRKVEAVFIEGHTDNVPLGRTLSNRTGLKDNRELSTIRAVHTYNEMLGYAPELASYRNNSDQPVISVSGYGSDRPVTGHEWQIPTNDPVNRRIDIRIIMTPFSKGDIQQISGGAS